jgi:hypothetical protein
VEPRELFFIGRVVIIVVLPLVSVFGVGERDYEE